MSGAGRITVSVSHAVAAVEIDNPARRNALTRDMCVQLQELMPRLDADPAVTVVTLRGAGDTFCAGAAINELPEVLLGRREGDGGIDQLSKADDAITAVSKPTIALVDGACIGAGWQIASACDFIVASGRSVFAITPAKIGILYPRTGIERLVRMVGPATAKFILFSAETFPATQAQALGLVADVVSDDDFTQHCAALVESVLGRSRFSIHTLKRLVDLTAVNSGELDQEWDDAWAAMTGSPDMEIGVDAFLTRTPPEFRWSPP